jgi:predicted enzyme related to lactoylglutathione lyase
VTVGPHDRVHGRNSQPGRLISLKAAGATVVQDPYQPGEAPEGWIATLSDPDDNYFQLVSPI